MKVTKLDKVETVQIVPGQEYEFHCEVEERELPAEQRLRNYTGQKALVLGLVGPDRNDPENSPMWDIRFADGREAQAWDEELSGWDKAKGQFFGPAGKWGDPS